MWDFRNARVFTTENSATKITSAAAAITRPFDLPRGLFFSSAFFSKVVCVIPYSPFPSGQPAASKTLAPLFAVCVAST